MTSQLPCFPYFFCCWQLRKRHRKRGSCDVIKVLFMAFITTLETVRWGPCETVQVFKLQLLEPRCYNRQRSTHFLFSSCSEQEVWRRMSIINQSSYTFVNSYSRFSIPRQLKYGFLKKSLGLLLHPPKNNVWKWSTNKGAFI